jgi:hypothetical protein
MALPGWGEVLHHIPYACIMMSMPRYARKDKDCKRMVLAALAECRRELLKIVAEMERRARPKPPKSVISERLRKTVAIRWARTSEEERKAHGRELAAKRWAQYRAKKASQADAAEDQP